MAARGARHWASGSALVRAVEDGGTRGAGCTAVDLHAQTQALGFYERLGYTAYGPEDQEAGIRAPVHAAFAVADGGRATLKAWMH